MGIDARSQGNPSAKKHEKVPPIGVKKHSIVPLRLPHRPGAGPMLALVIQQLLVLCVCVFFFVRACVLAAGRDVLTCVIYEIHAVCGVGLLD